MNSKHPMLNLSSFSPIHFLFYSLVISLSSTVICGGIETDHEALLKIKSLITRDPYGALTSWNDSLHLCDWSHVYCGKRHRRVTIIDLSSQGLEGSLSPHVGNLSFLHLLFLYNNSFQGAIPQELGRLSRLRRLYLYQNKFNEVIPTNISSCFNLEVIGLSNNELVGSIPKEISSLTKLTFLALFKNKLTGGIPPYLGNMTSLEVFFLNENPLGGTIPDTLGLMKSLKAITLSGCNLYGTIPNSLYNLSLLANISLSDNQLTGGLYSAVGAMLPNLVWFQFWGNKLSGPLPASISNCTSLKLLELQNNMFSGHLTIDFSKLTNIYVINIGGNPFGSKEADETKFIDSLKNCTRLKMLSFAKCKFQGVLPRSIGEVPMLGVFANESAFSVLGNRRLCGGIIELGLPKCKETSKFTKKLHLYLIVALIASALFTATCLAYAWCKKKRKSHLSQSSTSERNLKVSYSQLLKATNGFSESNLIGTGGYSSVYKGILFEDNDTFVAIKVLHLQNRGAQRSFMRECEAWRNL
ncbi:putative non-specific serine/threonine protein kinase [Helianthus annuus]|nr:putative non-specific serine/threonine protein kinase [Helianthus annuus]